MTPAYSPLLPQLVAQLISCGPLVGVGSSGRTPSARQAELHRLEAAIACAPKPPTTADLMECLGLARSTALDYLKQLIEARRVVRVRIGHSFVYALAPGVADECQH